MFHYTTVRESYSSVSTPLLSYDPTRIDQILLGTLKLLAESTIADLDKKPMPKEAKKKKGQRNSETSDGKHRSSSMLWLEAWRR